MLGLPRLASMKMSSLSLTACGAYVHELQGSDLEMDGSQLQKLLHFHFKEFHRCV